MKGRILWCLMFAVCFAALAFNSQTRAFALGNVLVAASIFLATRRYSENESLSSRSFSVN